MGPINKILSMMKMTDDMDEEYDDIDDGYYEEDYEEEPKPKNSFTQKKQFIVFLTTVMLIHFQFL